MWPWGHLAVGYVLYSVLVRLHHGRSPSGAPALVAAFGTQFPDLIDKPLAWTFHILPSGRSLTHSVFTAAIVIGVVAWYAQRCNRSELAVAFGVGYLSHLFADAIGPFLNGEYLFLTFLGWPIFPPPPYSNEGGFLSHFADFELTPSATVQIILAFAVFGLWLRDGTPGVRVISSWLPSRLSRESDPDR